VAHVVEVLDALHWLHGQGIVHRDVKPENVLLDEHDVALLCDFGIAHRRSTGTPGSFGTPEFVPPEQFVDPDRVGPPADVFGAGVTLFVGLTGHSGMTLLVDHLRAEALAALPSPLARIVDRSTALQLQDRYASAYEMAMELADLL
jgi:serine/threonine-protein kinase